MNEQTWQYPSAHPSTDGPWANEPDKIQWVDPDTDLDCLIVRNEGGALCGYVGLPPGHRWHGLPHNDIDARVHGGLNFSDACDDSPPGDHPQICHIPAPGRPDDVWWIGFDCGHGGDQVPVFVAAGITHGTYRTVDYVKAEVRDLARQAQQ